MRLTKTLQTVGPWIFVVLYCLGVVLFGLFIGPEIIGH